MASEATESSTNLDHSDPSTPNANNSVNMPSLSSKSRDAGELQDMYRRTLAASWVSQPGELRADECVEDIFSGGDGWGSHLGMAGGKSSGNDNADDREARTRSPSANLEVHNERSSRSKSPRRFFSSQGTRHGKDKSIDSTKRSGFGEWGTPGTPNSRKSTDNAGSSNKQGIFGGRTSLQQQARRVEMEGQHRKKKEKRPNEIDEFDNTYREDLRAWAIDVKS